MFITGSILVLWSYFYMRKKKLMHAFMCDTDLHACISIITQFILSAHITGLLCLKANLSRVWALNLKDNFDLCSVATSQSPKYHPAHPTKNWPESYLSTQNFVQNTYTPFSDLYEDRKLMDFYRDLICCHFFAALYIFIFYSVVPCLFHATVFKMKVQFFLFFFLVGHVCIPHK